MLFAALGGPFACSVEAIKPACDAPAVAPSKGACFTGRGCNPVTAFGCQQGLGCVLGDDDAYHCFASSVTCAISPSVVWCDDATNFVDLCGACPNGSGNGPYCAPTMACLTTGRCARYCCDDDDCGGGSCDTEGIAGGVGISLE